MSQVSIYSGIVLAWPRNSWQYDISALSKGRAEPTTPRPVPAPSAMNHHLPTPPLSDWTRDASFSSEIKSLLASTWAVLQQPPPPSIREVLTAYNAKGTGDREMLLAMLNAKSAEDNRIAAMATLQNSMLQFYTSTAGSSQPFAAPLSPDSLSRSASGHGHDPGMPHQYVAGHAHHHGHHLPPSPSSRVNLPPVRTEPPRKRARSSRSPGRESPRSSRSPGPYPLHRRPSSHSSMEPPPSRAAMAIGSLLSSSYAAASTSDDRDRDAAWAPGARTSAERSTNVPVVADARS